MEEEVIDGELLGVIPEEGVTRDNLSKVQWRTRDGELIYLSDMDDNHIRNTAMLLTGFSYTKCGSPEAHKILWLKVLKMEWDRRIARRPRKQWLVKDDRHSFGPRGYLE